MQSPVNPLDPSRPELEALIRSLTALVEPAPVSLAVWSAEVAGRYQTNAKTTKLRLGQAVREAVELSGGSDATTASLTPELVARFAAREGRASTTNGLLAGLRRAMRIGVARGWIASSAVSRSTWTVPDLDPPRPRHHSEAAIAAVLGYLEQHAGSWDGGRLYAFAAILAYAGLRRNEALRLRVDDLDLTERVLWVRPNGGRLKTRASAAPVPMAGRLQEVLAAWLPRLRGPWCLPGSRQASPWLGGTAGRRAADRLKQAGEAVGVRGFCPHSLRHSLATHLATRVGLSPKQIQLVLRHSTVRTQDLYVHADLDGLRRILADVSFEPAAPASTTWSSPRSGPRPAPRLTLTF